MDILHGNPFFHLTVFEIWTLNFKCYAGGGAVSFFLLAGARYLDIISNFSAGKSWKTRPIYWIIIIKKTVFLLLILLFCLWAKNSNKLNQNLLSMYLLVHSKSPGYINPLKQTHSTNHGTNVQWAPTSCYIEGPRSLHYRDARLDNNAGLWERPLAVQLTLGIFTHKFAFNRITT